MNKFGVGATGRNIQISNLQPQPSLSPRDAMNLAAYLVAAACPLLPGTATEELGKFHKLVADASEGTDLEGAALAALEDE